MKTMSVALKAHYALGTTTIATCWKATLTNSTVVAATSLNRDLVVDAVTYKATTGYSPTNIDSTAELSPDNLEVDGFLASPAITDADIHSGLWDYAAIEVFEVNYADLTMGKNIMRSGTLGEVKAGRSSFIAELRGLMQAYSRTIVRLTGKECDADLGDTRCKKVLTAFTVTGTVGSVTGNRVINDAARTEVADWFTGGKMTFTSGPNNGLSMEVKKNVVGQIELHEQMPFIIAAGNTYSLVAGCTKRFTQDCIAKFANGVNFRGFPHLPGSAVFKRGGA